ncbi:hypothetical protein J8273_4270 [Carpediemonas membranifera]|uniref:Uncharacterized protein n=1 Tax=Carpediemonas membranifera TaxID=201153 RepID=A0A8J6AU23_9EUKA|nr:hypothetical protein J8273_4270 [Carpediemonas membranifera]|eukprot:KAG9394168.1 hypothetical protein J8273_4270 [Carpediemonas membranifera]
MNADSIEQQLREVQEAHSVASSQASAYDAVASHFRSLQHSHSKFAQQAETLRAKLSDVSEQNLQQHLNIMNDHRESRNEVESRGNSIESSRAVRAQHAATAKELKRRCQEMRRFKEQRDSEQLFTMRQKHTVERRQRVKQDLPALLASLKAQVAELSSKDVEQNMINVQTEAEDLRRTQAALLDRQEDVRRRKAEKEARAAEEHENRALAMQRTMLKGLQNRRREQLEQKSETVGQITAIDSQLDNKQAGEFSVLNYKRALAVAKKEQGLFRSHKAALADQSKEHRIRARTAEILDGLPMELGLNAGALSAEESANIQNVLAEVDTAVQHVKQGLAPDVRALRDKRVQVKDLDRVVEEAKTAYRRVTAGEEEETLALKREVAAGERAVAQMEAEVHRLTAMQHIDGIRGAFVDGKQYGPHLALLEAQASTREADLKAARHEQKAMKDNYETLQTQRSQFDQLRELLSAKVQSLGSAELEGTTTLLQNDLVDTTKMKALGSWGL